MDILIDRIDFDQQSTDKKITDLVSLATALETTANGLEKYPVVHASPEYTHARIQDCRRRAHLYRLIAERMTLLAMQGITEPFQDIEAAVKAA